MNIDPKILAENILEYLKQGNDLNEIKADALEQGISEEIWQAAIKLLSNKKKKKFSWKKIVIAVLTFIFLVYGFLWYRYSKTINSNYHSFYKYLSQSYINYSPFNSWTYIQKMETIYFKDKNISYFSNFDDLVNFLIEKEGNDIKINLLLIDYGKKSNSAHFYKDNGHFRSLQISKAGGAQMTKDKNSDKDKDLIQKPSIEAWRKIFIYINENLQETENKDFMINAYSPKDEKKGVVMLNVGESESIGDYNPYFFDFDGNFIGNDSNGLLKDE